MVEVELLGAALAPDGPGAHEVAQLCRLTCEARRVDEGHVAVEYVNAERIAQLNLSHRGKEGATDVLSFPIDEDRALGAGAPRELGDIVICPEHTTDLREAVIHGMLHLLGMDHERDNGEMLELQDELMARSRA